MWGSERRGTIGVDIPFGSLQAQYRRVCRIIRLHAARDKATQARAPERADACDEELETLHAACVAAGMPAPRGLKEIEAHRDEIAARLRAGEV